MATKPKKLNEKNVSECLVIIRDMYARYDPYEITEAYIINRREITAREEQEQLQAQIAELQAQVTKPLETPE